MRHRVIKTLFLAFFALFFFATAAQCEDPSLGVIQPRGLTQAPAFTLSGVDGAERSIKDFRGKVVLLNFWATWCEPCREEMPALERLWNEFKSRGLVVVAVAGDRGDMHGVGEFCRMRELTFPVLLDPAGEVKQAYGATMFPTSYVIGRDGSVKGKIVGPREWDGEQARRFFEAILR